MIKETTTITSDDPVLIESLIFRTSFSYVAHSTTFDISAQGSTPEDCRSNFKRITAKILKNAPLEDVEPVGDHTYRFLKRIAQRGYVERKEEIYREYGSPAFAVCFYTIDQET